MKKKLLTAAVGAALAAVPALYAQADVKVGGMAQVEIAQEKTSTAGTREVITVEDNSRGRFWITADEDLGGGMKGLAHFEFRVDTTGATGMEGTSTGNVGSSSENYVGRPQSGSDVTGSNIREKWVGLKADWGTVKLGSVRTPYKYYGGVSWDEFVTTNLEARGQGGMIGGTFGQNNFFDNAISYESPVWGGFSFGVAYVSDDAAVQSSPQGSTTDSGDRSFGVQWKGGPVHVVAAVAKNDTSAAATGDIENRKIGVKWDVIKDLSLIAQFEKGETDVGNTTSDQDVIFLGVHYKIGNTKLVAQLGNTETDATGATDTSEIDYLALGAVYNFSKTFRAFGGYVQRETTLVNGTATENKGLSVGLRKDF